MDDVAGLRRIAREIFLGALAARPGTMPPWVIDRMTALIAEQDAPAGHKLYSAGGAVEFVYLMRGGRIQLLREQHPTWTFEGRAFLGAQEIMLDRPHTRTAVAVTDLHLLRMPADAWVELLEDSFELTRASIIQSTAAVALLEEQVNDDAAAEPVSVPLIRLPKGRLNLIERLSVLIDIPILSRAGVQTLVDLATQVEEVVFAAGQVVLDRGVARDRGFVVLQGLVQASRSAPDRTRRYGPGSMVCGAAAFGPQSLPWEARAETETRALTILSEGWFDLMEEHFDIARAVLAGRAIEREQLLDQLVLQDPNIVFSR